MSKNDKFYFDNYVECAALAHKAATYLVECLENYDPDKIMQMLDEMHKIENSADNKKHEINAALVKAFVTPVDREDLDMLSQQLDDVTDTIEEVLQKFYIYDIRTMRSDAVVFAEKIVKSCELLNVIMAEFNNFKKSKKIQPLIIELNNVEEECDKLYLTSMRKLTKSGGDVLEILSWREIYNCLEECADACEHVSECVGLVVMKNT